MPIASKKKEQRLAIFPWKTGSRSATELSKALKVAQIKHEGSKFVGRRHKTVLNWGASEVPKEVLKCGRVLNGPEKLAAATDKLRFFRKIGAKARVVPWTDSRQEAMKWLTEKSTVVVRTTVTGHSGAGIVIAKPGCDGLAPAPLYTKYVPKDSEWRIHVFEGKVIDVQRKVRDPDREPTDWSVRSHANGFIFIRNTDPPHPDVLAQVGLAYEASGLDFGAFDVIFNKKQGKAYVLEVNTAPGLEGSSVDNYANALRKYL